MRWPADLAARVTAHWRFKVALSIGLTLLFCIPYFTLQRVTLFPVRTLALTPVDRAVVFDPRWVWVYQSVYVLIAVVPWLATSRPHLERYARGFAALSIVAFACFLLFPVTGPRPETVPNTGMFSWLVWYDRPTNALPSLHVGLAAFTVLFGARASAGPLESSARRWLLSIGVLWVAAIAYAALATKQHYAIDLPAGVLAAWLAHWLVQ
jgi:membrane-associated phospholipid phosphatase